MIRNLLGITGSGRLLLVAAAPAETRAIASAFGHTGTLTPWKPLEVANGLDLVESGVGKAQAAGATASLSASGAYAGVVNLGIAGALPNTTVPGRLEFNVDLGMIVLASEHVFADEGVQSPDGFLDLPSIGFSPWGCPGENTSRIPRLHRAPRAKHSGIDHCGPLATVSTCSGTDQGARAVATRTGAIAEAMEGAAVACVCARLGLPMAEIRVVSNTAGDRARQLWNLDLALARLSTWVREHVR
jgi:futalosine hydrolase